MEVLTSAEETQHAVCKIVTKELQATANVTLTRELKGVCTSSERIFMGKTTKIIFVLKVK